MKTVKVIHIHLQQEQTGEYVTLLQGMNQLYAQEILYIIQRHTQYSGKVMVHPTIGVYIRLLGNAMNVVKSEIEKRKLASTIKVHDHRVSF